MMVQAGMVFQGIMEEVGICVRDSSKWECFNGEISRTVLGGGVDTEEWGCR